MTAACLPPAPLALCQPDGRAAADGRYAGPILDLDTRHWDGRGPFARRRWQRKTWVYFGLFSPRFSLGFAIVDAGYLATAFCYVYDRDSGRLVEEKLLLPFGFAGDFHGDWRQPWQLGLGDKRWSCRRDGDGWLLDCSGPQLTLSARVNDHGRGLTAVSRSPGRPFHHTYKLCALDADINLVLHNTDGAAGSHRFPAGAMLDYTRGYPPRETLWNWASLDGQGEDGRRVALNLVAHFLNGNENALWLGDDLIPLAQTVFDYAPDDLLQPWRIRTLDGVVDLQFLPDGQRAENLRLGVLESVFSQPFGRFSGTVTTAEGPLRVQGTGVVEAHKARW